MQVPQSGGTGGTGHRGTDPDGQGLPGGSRARVALGLSQDEIALYNALASSEGAVWDLGGETLKNIAIEITKKLRDSTAVDWQVRESVRAKLRILVRRTLKKWKSPPVGEDAAIELVLKQAEALSNAGQSRRAIEEGGGRR